jgi:glycogen debranching enzyme
MLLVFCSNRFAQSPTEPATVIKLTPRFAAASSGLELSRRTQAGTFYDVVGRRAAAYGYEHRGMEAWVHPLKLVDDFKLAFKIEGYPLEFPASDIATQINVRPEATVFTYSHAAFTVRQTIFAPVDEQGIVMLLDVESVLPMSVRGSFRPRLRLGWPGGLMTGNLEWNEKEKIYYLTEDRQRFVGIIGSPGARDLSVQPYQEEPRDVPAEFVIEVPVEESRANLYPIIIAGSTQGRIAAKKTYDRLLNSVESLYSNNVEHYARLRRETVSIETPDKRFDEAFAWAKIGMDKGFATNPMLGTGLVAGFRTSGESERPGFAWFFGRDALWTSLALISEGDFAGTRTALDFLTKYQRADGKIPHEISQSAGLLPWFTDYDYPWSSADATPLYIITHGELYRASGDQGYLAANWESIKRAYRFSVATDTDGNGLIENTRFGHGWVEGGALYPAHEEIYMQGLWIEASRAVAELAAVMNDDRLARDARAGAERTRLATENTYWLADRNHYAFATQLPRATPAIAEPGPSRERRQTRLNELQIAALDRRRYGAARRPAVVEDARCGARANADRPPRERNARDRLGFTHYLESKPSL